MIDACFEESVASGGASAIVVDVDLEQAKHQIWQSSFAGPFLSSIAFGNWRLIMADHWCVSLAQGAGAHF